MFCVATTRRCRRPERTGRIGVAAVNEWIVREYFEWLGYFVTQPRKHVVPGRAKTADEEIDLLVVNPCVAQQRLPDKLVWSTEDLVDVGRAVVAVRGWHTERFYVSTVEQAPDILRFVEPEAIRFAAGLVGSSELARVLCLPRLPASDELREKLLQTLKEKGLDGVITFRTMLAGLIGAVDANRNYEKSDLLQVIRLMKIYDFLRDDQLELFSRRKPRRS